MNSPETHLAVAEDARQTCEQCGGLFTPARGWARFCKTKCRNDFHAKETRKEAIRARGLEMYDALRQIAGGFAQGGDAALLAQSAIKDLKAP